MKQSKLAYAAVPLALLIAAGAAQAQSSDPVAKPVTVSLARRGSHPAQPPSAAPPANASAAKPLPMIALAVPKGTPLEIALDHEVRVKKVGQPIHGRVMQPVYAFDQLVIPAGTQAIGRIRTIEPISRKKRFLWLLNANLTPAHKVQLEFDDLILPNGKHVPIDTAVGRGSEIGRAHV